MQDSITKASKKTLILIFWLLVWEIFSLFINNQILFPSPNRVFKSLYELILQEYFWRCIANSIIRVILGLLISILLGMLLGIFSGLNRSLEEVLIPIITTIKATPIMSIIIIALVWFKASNVSIFTTILICFPIIYTNIIEGIKSSDIKLIQMAKMYKVKKRYLIREFYIPSIRSYAISSILMCLGLAWKVSVTSEVLSTPKYSIGLNLLNSKTTLETEELFAWTIIVVMLSLLFELIFRYYVNKRNKF
ncbi:ABC transporter permease subunit [Clostridium botulinum]|uniref:ABC transporter permease n=1 Tax=Clostridium botulinum C/D str. DC5 TaxID=1443128 RepID=A0A0A0I9Q5_CLOBO|nr:ABC transporter permease subunit [Clostridium botulinum]KEI01617.1 ABC transporter permease [Clostridium botulinum C/D str. BKT75002]KEI07951.1 ABC transporter permease [Clostridium botulinum C/D str. BKT2873]KGM94373.1 ABC transporter permease [Clostridium botulinum D str. CCUG 7971]KGM97253.1 ABC transporter permease [Clostridium botulinum C/D str. DC5]KOC49437.1 ABC transporter permease [Clostridium botulinum]